MDINALLPLVKQAATAPITECDAMLDWFTHHQAVTQDIDSSLARAMIGGAYFQQASFAFASAYQSALENMFGLARSSMGALCHNEKGVKKPREMQSRIYEDKGTLKLDAKKGFVSGGVEAQTLFVSAIDKRPNAKGSIVLVQLNNTHNALDLKALPSLPFVPELSHAKFVCDEVSIAHDNILLGDGYSAYVKPFRTEEDLHILAALTGQRLALALGDVQKKGGGNDKYTAEKTVPLEKLVEQLAEPLAEQLIALAHLLLCLQENDRNDPTLHLSIAGLKRTMLTLFEQQDEVLKTSHPAFYKAWLRDKSLLAIAQQAQDIRTKRAWSSLAAL